MRHIILKLYDYPCLQLADGIAMTILIFLLTLIGYVASIRVNYQPIVAHPGGIGGIFRGPNSEISVKGPEGSVITADFQSAAFQPQEALQQNTTAQGQLLPLQRQSVAVTSIPESNTSYSNAVQGTQSAVPFRETQSIPGGIYSNRILENLAVSQSTAGPSSVLPLGHSTIVVESSTPLTSVSQTNNYFEVASRGVPLLLNAIIDPHSSSVQQSSNLRLVVRPPPRNLDSVSSNRAVSSSVRNTISSTLVSPTGAEPGVALSSIATPATETIIPEVAVPSSAYSPTIEATSNRRIESNVIPVSETYPIDSGSLNSPSINQQIEENSRFQLEQNGNPDNVYTLRQPVPISTDTAQSRPGLIRRYQMANQNGISSQTATPNRRIESNTIPVSETYSNYIGGSLNPPSTNEQIEQNYRLQLQQNGNLDNVYTLRQPVPISTDATQSRPRLIPRYQIADPSGISSQSVSQNLQSLTAQISSGITSNERISVEDGRFQIVDSTQSGQYNGILSPSIPPNVGVRTGQSPPRSNDETSVPVERYQYVPNYQRVEPNLILSTPQNPTYQTQQSPSSITNNGEITVTVAQELQDSRSSSELFTPAGKSRYSSSDLVTSGRNSVGSSQRVGDNVAVEGTSSYILADERQVPYDDGQLPLQGGTSSSRPSINIDNRQLLVDPSRIPARNIIPPEIQLNYHRTTEKVDPISRDGVLSTPRAPGLHSSNLRPNTSSRNSANAASSVSTNQAITNINQNINVNLNQVQLPSSRTSAIDFPTVQTLSDVGISGLVQGQQSAALLDSTQQNRERVVNGELSTSQIRQPHFAQQTQQTISRSNPIQRAPTLIRNEEVSWSQLSQQSRSSVPTLQTGGPISNEGILSSQLRQQGVDPSEIIFSRVPLSAITAIESAGAVNTHDNSGRTYSET